MSEPVVHIENATVYQQDNLVLENVNLTLDKGEFVFLVGKTGSGKSSLLKLMYGDLPLAKGNGKVVGFNLNEMSWKKVPFLRRKLGIVFQDFQLLMDRSIEDNLKFVMRATGWKDKKAIQSRVQESLYLVGVEDKLKRMPHEVSGGEQQRVVIARALLNKPELILADEPTGNLDPDTSDEITGLLHSISKNIGTTLLIATHDYLALEKFNARILKCVDKSIFEQQDLRV